jgi:UDP-glucose 4-epimerase
MRALVTGGTGFLGNRLVLELVEQGWEVTCLVRRPCRSRYPSISRLTGDLLQSEGLRAALSELRPMDAVFHFGAVLPSPESTLAEYLRGNTVASAIVVDWAAKAGVPAVVCASTITVIGRPEQVPVTESHPLHPTNPYSISKMCAEFVVEGAVRDGNTRASSLRITSPYGPGMTPTTVLPLFVERGLASEPLGYHGTGSRAQDFVHVSDVVRAALGAMQAKAGGVFNIAGGGAIAMVDLAAMVCSMIAGSRSRPKPSREADPQEGWRWEVDYSRARKAFGYVPQVDLRQGLQDYLSYRSQRKAVPRWWEEL